MKMNTNKPNSVLFIICIFALQTISLQGQGLYDLTAFYRNNWQVLNPAAVDYTYIFDHSHEHFLNGSVRQQWNKLSKDIAPKVITASYENHPTNIPSIKYGAILHNYDAGYISHMRFQANFAYKIFLNSSDHFIAVGLNAGVADFRIDLGRIDWVGQQYNDDYINQYPDIAMGAFYVNNKRSSYYMERPGMKKYFIGISVPKLFVDPIYTELNETTSLQTYDRVFPVYLVGGLDYQLTEFVRLEPSVWVRWGGLTESGFDPVPSSIDVRLTTTLLKNYWGQLGYDTANNVYGALGSFIPINLGSSAEPSLLKVGVNFDFNVDQWSAFGPSIEAMVGYAW